MLPMNITSLLSLMRREIDTVGSLRSWAALKEISAPFVSRVLNGHKEPSDRVLDAFDVERVVTYRKKK